MKKTKAEIRAAGTRPGVEGCIWRLVEHWNPDGIKDWLVGEQSRMTPPEMTAHALGSLMASVVMGFGQCTDDFDKAIFAPGIGLKARFKSELQSKLDNYRRTDGGIILPGPGVVQ